MLLRAGVPQTANFFILYILFGVSVEEMPDALPFPSLTFRLTQYATLVPPLPAGVCGPLVDAAPALGLVDDQLQAAGSQEGGQEGQEESGAGGDVQVGGGGGREGVVPVG